MMQGTLQYQLQQGSRYHEISQQRMLKMLREIAPSVHRGRGRDMLDRTNPVPCDATYFRYKMHMDQNEKLAQEFGVTHVNALDGCRRRRMVPGSITIPKKNLYSSTSVYFSKWTF